MLLNPLELVLESEKFIEEKYISNYLSEMTDTTKKTLLTYGGIVAGGHAANFAAAKIDRELPIATSLIGSSIAIGYLINRYRTSLYRINKKVNKFSELVQKAKSEKNSEAAYKYNEKLKIWKDKLEQTKSRLRQENVNFIEKTKKMKQELDTMKKHKFGQDKISKLENKIKDREKFIQKIGAKI